MGPPAVLLQAAWPAGLSPGGAALAATAALFTPLPLTKGQALLHQGGCLQHALLLERGLLRLHFV